ncbi:transposable element Tcb1 transposase [Trichonephila clavipes]|nr:transposable element Tcb1 transposase [Trichonephila clavipes]
MAGLQWYWAHDMPAMIRCLDHWVTAALCGSLEAMEKNSWLVCRRNAYVMYGGGGEEQISKSSEIGKFFANTAKVLLLHSKALGIILWIAVRTEDRTSERRIDTSGTINSLAERNVYIRWWQELKLSVEATRVSRKSLDAIKSDELIENKRGRERKSILSDVAKRKVLKDIKIDPKLSVVKLAAETSLIIGRCVSAETVRNLIRHAGYSSRVARKKPFISLQNQEKRLEFTKTHQLKTDNFWKKVIFSDESKFNFLEVMAVAPFGESRTPLWIQKKLRPAVILGGGSVMVWGCMASNGVGN